MPITAQQLLQILPNAGQSAGVFVPALNTAMNHYQIIGTKRIAAFIAQIGHCLLYTSPSPRDGLLSRMPSSA